MTKLEGLFDDVLAGKREPRVATAAATVALAIGRLITAGEYEERLRALEAAAERTRRERAAEGQDDGLRRRGPTWR